MEVTNRGRLSSVLYGKERHKFPALVNWLVGNSTFCNKPCIHPNQNHLSASVFTTLFFEIPLYYLPLASHLCLIPSRVCKQRHIYKEGNSVKCYGHGVT
jgi:hypothetical protein